ncbi:MAG TPA: glycosyltransferase 87 family protein [Acidimicrobiia bacterium]|nr:glycosyltransferase 87 family protein [Acidimicrobiia bacterium]
MDPDVVAGATTIQRSQQPRTRHDPAIEPFAIAVAVASTALVMLANLRGVDGVTLIAIGTAAATWLGTRKSLDIPRAAPWAAMALLAVIAVGRAPLGSHDMWAYVSYGRLVEHYHADPYHVVVARFPADPVFQLVGRVWWHTPSAYGPLLVGFAAVLSRLAGTSLVMLRLGFQVPAAVAMFACVWIAARTTRRRAVVVLIGLQPMVWISVVNGAHADVYVALGAVAAVALLRHDRVVGAAVVLGLAALVKIAALFAAPVMVAVLLGRKRVHDAARFTAGTGALMVIAWLVAPSSFFSAARATHGIISRASPWRLVVSAHLTSSATASVLGLLAAAIIIAEVARRCRDTSDLAAPIALALASYAIVAGFTLPWYAVWSMPVAAMSRRRSIAVVTALHGAILLAAYQAGPASFSGRFSGGLLTIVLPIVTVATLLVLVVSQPAPRMSRLRRVDVDASSGQLGAQLVQGGQRGFRSGAVGRRDREHECFDDDERDAVAREESGCSATAAQHRVDALGHPAARVGDQDDRHADRGRAVEKHSNVRLQSPVREHDDGIAGCDREELVGERRTGVHQRDARLPDPLAE